MHSNTFKLNTGFLKKDGRFSKFLNNLDLLSGDKKGKLMEQIDFRYFSIRASFMRNPVAIAC